MSAARSDAELIAAWRAGVSQLDPGAMPPVPGIRPAVWPAVHAAMLLFLDTWGERAAALGYDELLLFGVHYRAGAVRVDSCGLLVSERIHTIVEMTKGAVALERGAARSTFRGLTNRAESVAIWDFRGKASRSA